MERIKDAVIKFFEKRDAKIEIYEDYFILDYSDEEFKKLMGYGPPYKVLFNGKREGYECLEKGTKFFDSFMKLLNKGTSKSILRIEFKVGPLKEVGSRISLKNCRLGEVKENYENNFFSRFTFRTLIRHMNKTEEIIKEIFIHEGKIVEGDLGGYKISEGELEKVDGDFLEGDYELAKSRVRELIRPKLDEIKDIILKKLNSETDRIKNHYQTQIKELNDDNLKKICKGEGKTKEELLAEIEKINREEEYSVKDNRQKYSLGVETELINSSIIYYPVYRINLEIVDGVRKKNLDIEYNPLTESLTNLECPSCSTQIKEIVLCSSGHISCPECLFRCTSCGNPFCKIHLTHKCSSCGGPVCDGCVKRCKSCRSIYCKEHIREDSISGESYCSNCISFCEECRQIVKQEKILQGLDKRNICENCLMKKKKDKILKDIFADQD